MTAMANRSVTATVESAPAPVAEDRGRESSWLMVGLFLIGALSVLPLPGTSVLLPELIFVAMMPVIVRGLREDRFLRWGVLSLAVWFLAELLTDAYRDVPIGASLLSLANIAFAAIDLMGFFALIAQRPSRALYLAYGLPFVGLLLIPMIAGTIAAYDPWKFAYGGPVSIGVALGAGALLARGRPVLAAGAMLAIGLLNIGLGARSLGGFCLAAAVLVVVGPKTVVPVRRVLAIVGSFIITGVIAIVGYQWLALNGHLGATIQQKSIDNNGQYGILLGGRKNWFFEWHFIGQSPLIGQGSRPKMNAQDAGAVVQQIRELGYTFNGTDAASYIVNGAVPRHSALVDSWLAAGVVGVVPWILALALVVAWLRYPTPPQLRKLYPLTAFLAGNLVWSTFFSPFALAQRPLTAISIALLALTFQVNRAEQTRLKSPSEDVTASTTGSA
jgi:hypothetical protein